MGPRAEGDDLEKLDAATARLERQTTVDRRGRVVLRPTARRPTLLAVALTSVLVLVMVTVGDQPIGRHPLAERLLAYDVLLLVVSAVLSLVLGVVSLTGRTRVRRPARLLGWTAYALALSLVTLLVLSAVLPLHLEGVLRPGSS